MLGRDLDALWVGEGMDAHLAVRESAVIGVDHPELGQEIKAFVILEPGATVEEHELEEWIGQKLARYKVPRLWSIRREPLPRNAAGKVLKNILSDETKTSGEKA